MADNSLHIKKLKNMLLEYGFLSFGDEKLVAYIKELSKEIFEYFEQYKNEFNKKYNAQIFGETYINGSKRIIFNEQARAFHCQIDMSYLRHLFVFVSFTDNYADAMTVASSVSYKQSDALTDNNFYFKYKDKEQMPADKFDDNGNCVYMSVFIRLGKNTQYFDLLEELLHEVQHIVDLNMYNSYAQMNNDVIRTDLIKCTTDRTVDNVIEKLNDIDYINEFVKSISLNQLKYIFKQYIFYYTNVSEMNAYLTSFIKEIKDISKNQTYDSLSDKLKKSSRIFNVYTNIYNVLTALIDYCPTSIKKQFAIDVIMQIVDKDINTKRLSGTCYNKYYIVDGKYNDMSFDNLCNDLILKIANHFIKDACQIYHKYNPLYESNYIGIRKNPMRFVQQIQSIYFNHLDVNDETFDIINMDNVHYIITKADELSNNVESYISDIINEVGTSKTTNTSDLRKISSTFNVAYTTYLILMLIKDKSPDYFRDWISEYYESDFNLMFELLSKRLKTLYIDNIINYIKTGNLITNDYNLI